MNINLAKLVTESCNPATMKIDTLPTVEMLEMINSEDQKVALAVKSVIPQVAKAVDVITHAFSQGGRLFYLGAGTSGRLGILDASECPPTFGTPPSQVVGLIAGGHKAILKAVENAEDNLELGRNDLAEHSLRDKDVVVGIAASGRTPYVLGALAYATSIGAKTISVACNSNCEMADAAEIAILPVVGPEVIAGSSRMKAGSAQKLVLNMLTTGAMINSGKVFGNLMVDVEATNAKLIQRQTNIVIEATGASEQEAEQALNNCDRHCKTAIVMILTSLNAEQAKLHLAQNNGFIRATINNK